MLVYQHLSTHYFDYYSIVWVGMSEDVAQQTRLRGEVKIKSPYALVYLKDTISRNIKEHLSITAFEPQGTHRDQEQIITDKTLQSLELRSD